MFVHYQNVNGGINNLVVVESDGVITTSLKDKATAIKNHKRKILRLRAKKNKRGETNETIMC